MICQTKNKRIASRIFDTLYSENNDDAFYENVVKILDQKEDYMRPSTEELYKLDPLDFLGTPYEIVIKDKLDSAFKEKKILSEEIKRNDIGYEELAGINSSIRYYDKAIKWLLAEYEDMGLTYRRED